MVGLSEDPNAVEPQITPQGALPPVKPRSNLFSPVPIEEQAPRMGQTGRIRKGIAFDPESVADQNLPLKNMAPRRGPVDAQAQPETNPNSTLGRAVDRATGMVGMHERVNQRDIQQYLTTGGAGMNPAKTAWCAAFVNASLKMGGVGGSGSQVATSFMDKGQPVTTEPQKGDVVVESRGLRPGQPGGHVGLATGRTRLGPTGYEFEVVSGNLSNRVGREWVPAQKATVRRMTEPVTTQAVKGVPTTAIPGSVAPQVGQNFVPIQPDDEAVDVAVKTPTVEAPAPAATTPNVPAPAQVAGGPVYAPPGTPLEELTRLSQTKPWGSKQGVLRSWKKSQLGPEGSINEFKSVVPSEMGGVQPSMPTEQEQLLSEDDAYNALESSHEAPLYIRQEIPFDYEYRNPPENVTEIEPMPIAETASMPLPPLPPEDVPSNVTRSDLISRPPVEAIASPQQFRFVVPEKSLPLDDQGQPSIAQLGLQIAQDAVGDPTVGVRRFGQGFQSATGQMIYLLPASINAIKALPYALATGNVHPHDMEQVNFWLRRMGEAETGSRKLWGFDPEVTPESAEKLYQMAGESVVPAKAWTLPLSILNLGVRAIIDPHSPVSLNPVSEAEAAPGKKKAKTFDEKQAERDEVIDRATGLSMKEIPGQLENGNVIAGSISGPVFGTPIPQPDGTVLLVPNASIRGDRNLTGDEAVAQYARSKLNYGLFDSVESANKFLEILNSRVTQTTNTASGPQQIKVSDLALLGTLGALTIGMAGAPAFARLFKSGKLPVLTPDMGASVKNAAPGTTSYTRLRDYYHTTVHDFYAAPKNLLKRSGATPEQLFDFDVRYANTRGGATNVAQSAIVTGRAATPEFNFQVKNARPIGDLVKVGESPEVKEYLYLLNTFEEIIQTNKQTIASQGVVPAGANPKAPNPGPVTVRDWTEATIGPKLKQLETEHPHVLSIAKELRANNRELLRIESTGQWATKTKAEAREEAITRPNYIDYGKYNWEDANPFVLASNRMNEVFRYRLENAAHGPFVNHMNTVRPGMFVEVSPTQVGPKQFANWEPNSIKTYEYGRPRHYTTDPLLASTMKLDPHYYHSAPGAASVVRWLGAPKRMMEIGTTRWLAPWFSVTNMRRNHNLVALATPGADLQRPYIHQSMAEIYRDVIPQITNGLAKSFDNTGLIGRTFGKNAPAWLDTLGKRWANTYIDSNHARIQRHGGNYGSAYDQRITTDRIISENLSKVSGEANVFLRSLQNFLGAVHGAPTNATVRKNWYRTELPKTDPNYLHPSDLVTRTRRLTGDPVVQGEMFGAGPVRYNARTLEEKVALKGLQAVGATAELARVMVPWFNTTAQGIKGVGRSYINSPGKFTAKLWTTQLFPTAIIYAWNQSLGRDSQGVSYSNHQMNGRSPYNTMMSHYIGIPGRPASEGMELPFKVHELSLFQRWFEIAMDHMFSDPKHTAVEDWRYMWKSWLNVAGDVPFPTLANWVLAYTGNTPAQGIMENNTYKVKESPYDQHKGLPVNVEYMMRAIGGGISDVLGSGAAAMIQEENAFLKPAAGIKEMGIRAAQRTPILRDVFNIAPPISGNTRTAQEVFEYRDILRKLDDHYRNYGFGGGRKISNKPASGPGGLIVRGQLGPASPEIAPGLPQPTTTNPLYNTYMAMVHDKITKDVPEKGGMGLKSAMTEYFKTTKELATLRNVTSANQSAWQRWINMDQNKPLIEFLEQNNVDHKRPTAVINFYQARRQATMEVILKMFKSVEHEIEKKTGRPFNINMLKPYSKLDDLPPVMKRDDVKELMQGEFYAGTQVPGGQ
jgi:uncharacterized protein (TIGR02594 family)